MICPLLILSFPRAKFLVIYGTEPSLDSRDDFSPSVASSTTLNVPSTNLLATSNLLIFPDVVLLMDLGLIVIMEAIDTPCSSTTRVQIRLITSQGSDL